MGRIRHDMEWTGTIIASTCSERHATGPYAGDEPETGSAAIDCLRELLEAYGMAVDVTTTGDHATISIRHPHPAQAAMIRNRGGGRRSKGLPEDSPLQGMSDADALAWLDSHTEAEGIAAMGVSRRTYYRRLDSLRSTGRMTRVRL